MIDLKKQYRNIYILESINHWTIYSDTLELECDLVLTFDFALKHKVEKMGGTALYIDKLCSPANMQINNFIAAEFLKNWHFDKHGNDIFTKNGIPFGFAFRIEMWSEYIFYLRLRCNLEQLRKVNFNTIIVSEHGISVGNILREMGLVFETNAVCVPLSKYSYFFDIHKYMRDALHGKSLLQICKKVLAHTLSHIIYYFDLISQITKNKKTVYAQIYHPTKSIVEQLLDDSSLRIVTSSLVTRTGIKKYFVQRLIPIRGNKENYDKIADFLFKKFKAERCARLILSDGTEITSGAYEVIEHQIQERLSEALQILDSVNAYIKRFPICLEIMIANIGLVQTIVDCVLKTKAVPSYLIINGLMPSKFGDDAKYATYINSYGSETKRNYFENAKNIVCLGDPRMDQYITNRIDFEKIVNRDNPTVSIGTSGFNNIDLISHVAVEFDFMYDLLTAFTALKNEGQQFSIIIKVRPNGVLAQYSSFVADYFPDLEVELIREAPISQVLNRTDLYISIYSQTLFEASCLGIPVIYYKKDQEFLDPPFDTKSELITVDTVNDLKRAFYDFKANDPRFDQFLDKSVMEKYIGPLDGKSTERNLEFIHGLLSKPRHEA